MTKKNKRQGNKQDDQIDQAAEMNRMIESQNQNHNTKKEALGPNTKK